MKTKKITLVKIGMILLMALATVNMQKANGQLSQGTGGVIIPNAPTTNTNVGIGTTNPAFKLQVVTGTIGASGIGVYNGNTGGSEIRLQPSISGSHTYGLQSNGTTGSGSVGSFGIYDYSSALNRMLIDATGNVGIASNNPQTTLHIGLLNPNPALVPTYTAPTPDTGGPNVNLEGLSIQSYTNNSDNFRRYIDFAAKGYNNGGAGGSAFRFLTNDKNSGSVLERMRIDINGNVSINTTSTSADAHKLQVHNGNIMISGASPGFGGPMILFSDNVTSSQYPNGRWGIEYEPNVHGLNFWRPWNPSTGGGGNYHLFLNDNGKIGMGIDPTTFGGIAFPGNYKLYVKDGILTEKIKVAVYCTTNWADYVFADDYKLKPLDEVEEFIKENKHLPGVLSANELVKEGLDLGGMQAKQMEKIEELTLYMIQMNKKIVRLEDENTALKSSIANTKN